MVIKKDTMKNLIREDFNFNIKDGWYCEETHPPAGNKSKEGEEIYIAQNDMQFC